MTLRDRGIKKWMQAFVQPEQAKMQREFWRDTERIAKPIIDEYEAEDFDLRINYAMTYGHAVVFTLWNDGFTYDVQGAVCSIDPITHEIRIEVKPKELERVSFQDVISVKVLD